VSIGGASILFNGDDRVSPGDVRDRTSVERALRESSRLHEAALPGLYADYRSYSIRMFSGTALLFEGIREKGHRVSENIILRV